MNHRGLLDQIYESAFKPELLESCLTQIAEIAGAEAGYVLVRLGSEDAAGVANWRLAACVGLSENVALASPLATLDAGSISLERATHEFVAETGVPEPGLTRGVVTLLKGPESQVIVGFRRRLQDPAFDAATLVELDELRPHIARSVFIAARMRKERANVAAQLLEALGVPAIVFGDGAEISALNSLVEKRGDLVRWLPRASVGFRDAAADAQLRTAAANIQKGDSATIYAFPVRNADAVPEAVAYVVPIRGSGHLLTGKPAFVLVLLPVAARPAPSTELVGSLFALTPGEARVAAGLALGKSVEDLAEDGGISVNTVRTYVRGVLEKTGTRRQGDAMLLLSGLSLGRQPSVLLREESRIATQAPARVKFAQQRTYPAPGRPELFVTNTQ